VLTYPGAAFATFVTFASIPCSGAADAPFASKAARSMLRVPQQTGVASAAGVDAGASGVLSWRS